MQQSAQGKFQVITKILIANRGEIAVRIVRACAEMGIRSVAVYSDADRHALHVKRADEAHSIGAEPLAGYLNPRKLVNLAVETGCDALHPGYGFLSENAELADICAERGIKFIGPSAEVIRRMGDKTEARRSMIKAGVPVTPGTEGNVADIAEALTEGDRIGYPALADAVGVEREVVLQMIMEINQVFSTVGAPACVLTEPEVTTLPDGTVRVQPVVLMLGAVARTLSIH